MPTRDSDLYRTYFGVELAIVFAQQGTDWPNRLVRGDEESVRVEIPETLSFPVTRQLQETIETSLQVARRVLVATTEVDPATTLWRRLRLVGEKGRFDYEPTDGSWSDPVTREDTARSVGHVVAIASGAGEGTDAVGDLLETRELPDHPSAFFRRFFWTLADSDLSDFAEDKFDEFADHNIDIYEFFPSLFGAAEPECTDWLTQDSPQGELVRQLENLIRSSDRFALPVSDDGPDDAQTESSSTTKPELADWLERRGHLRDLADWDSGLEKIWSWHRESGSTSPSADERDALLETRISCLRDYYDDEIESGRPDQRIDFDELAPFPPVKFDAIRDMLEQTVDLRTPVMTALWTVERFRDAFPGHFGGERMRVEAVELVPARLTDDDQTGRVPDDTGVVCSLFDGSSPGRTEPPALRPFGRHLLDFCREHKKGASDYFVRLRIVVDSENVDLVLPFGWPYDDTASDDFSQRLEADAQRVHEAAENLRRLSENEALQRHLPVNLAEEIDAFASAARELADATGVPERGDLARAGLLADPEATGPPREALDSEPAPRSIWSPAGDLLSRFENLAEGLAEAFQYCGEWAPRLATRVLTPVLTFGVHQTGQNDGSSSTAVVEDFHPIRLQRLYEIERFAVTEIERFADSPGSLRDVPIARRPPIDDAPAVIWWNETFLVPDVVEQQRPWRLRFARFRDESRATANLTDAVDDTLTRYVRCLFPGMQRRLQLRLAPSSRTRDARHPLRLAANLTMDESAWRQDEPVADGVDLFVAESDGETTQPAEIDRTMSVEALGEQFGSVRVSDALAKLLQSEDSELDDRNVFDALQESAADEPRFRLEVFREMLDSSGTAATRHLELMVRPWALEREWNTRELDSEVTEGEDTFRTREQTTAPTWELASRAWTDVQITSRFEASADQSDARTSAHTLDARFQHLLIRRWRRESDRARRILGLSLETDPSYKLGKRIWDELHAATSRSPRILIVDDVFGPEAIDSHDPNAVDADDDIEVCWADYDSAEGRKITIVTSSERAEWSREQREIATIKRGLGSVYQAPGEPSDALAECVYDATHRAVPGVALELWRIAHPEVDPELFDAEKLGHLGAALFAHPGRERITFPDDTDRDHWWQSPFPEGTILLSMDELQKWTWTRSGGQRGDFIAVVPHDDERTLRIVAIEVKGSLQTNSQSDKAIEQATTSCGKLRETFSGEERRSQRRELLSILAIQAFRAQTNHRAAHDMLANFNGSSDSPTIEFDAVALSTMAGRGENSEASGLELREKSACWIGVTGIQGVVQLALGH